MHSFYHLGDEILSFFNLKQNFVWNLEPKTYFRLYTFKSFVLNNYKSIFFEPKYSPVDKNLTFHVGIMQKENGLAWLKYYKYVIAIEI